MMGFMLPLHKHKNRLQHIAVYSDEFSPQNVNDKIINVQKSIILQTAYLALSNSKICYVNLICVTQTFYFANSPMQ